MGLFGSSSVQNKTAQLRAGKPGLNQLPRQHGPEL